MKFAAKVALFALAAALLAALADAAHPGDGKSVNFPTGTWTAADGSTGPASAVFYPKKFQSRGQELVLFGDMTFDLPGAPVRGTRVKRQLTQPVAVPAAVTQPGEACDILNLDLGPLDLNLLGLRIQLSEINLDITAVPGPGNLLGNLLCAVAGLLDNTGTGGVLQQITGLLNQILGLLGTL
ncbi:hypothetical protein DFJ74DRAFT_723272 [Hyaloraphidium curvatum]|nr:hypothetical protein DFJ74DRAFT_723272 [Hyaloraphidium curvatum]